MQCNNATKLHCIRLALLHHNNNVWKYSLKITCVLNSCSSIKRKEWKCVDLCDYDREWSFRLPSNALSKRSIWVKCMVAKNEREEWPKRIDPYWLFVCFEIFTKNIIFCMQCVICLQALMENSVWLISDY